MALTHLALDRDPMTAVAMQAKFPTTMSMKNTGRRIRDE